MPDPKTVATITANGLIFKGWKSLTVRRDYSDFVSTFSFTCSDVNNAAKSLLPGTKCVITLGGKTALTGYITTRGCSFDAQSHDLVIAGKSLTTDVNDSSVKVGGSTNGYNAEQLARMALQPHGIGLKVVNPPANFAKAFKWFAVNPGETGGEFIERACAMRGVFMWDDEQGNLCVGQGDPSTAAVAQFVEGRNILRCVAKLDDQASVGTWNVYGQQPSSDDDWPARNAQATATDPSARQNRTQIVNAPHTADTEDAGSYANLLAARAGWHDVDVEITVAGWFRPDGELWGLMNNCTVYSPMAFPTPDGKVTLGTRSVTFSQDSENGTTTTLSLIRPEFMTPMGHAGVSSDNAGDILPAVPAAPDTSGQ